MLRALSRQTFDRLLDRYEPSRYEDFGRHNARFAKPMHHALKCRERLYVAMRSGLDRLAADGATVLDFGPYPGSLLRLIRALRPSSNCRLIGAGLMAGPEFVQHMKDDCLADILTVNLDPANHQFRAKGYPDRTPLADGVADLAFALEIIEHLTSPFHLLAEAFRVLAPGAHLIVTTPNVTRIGNVFKLLVGRSPNDRLAPPGYDDPDDEWRPHAREYSMDELVQMLAQTGFEVVERRFFLGEDTQDCRQSVKQSMMDFAKFPFYAVPHLRGSLLAVGRKPS